jgi:hypothetical protein
MLIPHRHTAQHEHTTLACWPGHFIPEMNAVLSQFECQESQAPLNHQGNITKATPNHTSGL